MESIHDYVFDRLQAHKGNWPQVSKITGVPYGTLKKIGTRVSRAPRIDNLEKLASYFRAHKAEMRQ